VQRRHRILMGAATLGVVALLAGCASKPSSTASAANYIEGGVKIPGTGSTSPSSTVDVTLGDRGAGGAMSLALSTSSVAAGDVTFVVKNAGTIVHEAVVLKTDVPFDKLPVTYGGDPPVPVTSGANKVSEDANVGETGDPDLEPGGTRTFTIKHMKAGNYVVVCNIAGHYAKGMRAPLTVT
jgi:uncharacterized cupredoxin-like copper-binding protein